jgi:SAM-dependent methyltransferase
MAAAADGGVCGRPVEIYSLSTRNAAAAVAAALVMSIPLTQHQTEIQGNLRAWRDKPLLQQLYGGFYQRILPWIDRGIPGRIVEIGSGIGNLKEHLAGAIATDLFPNPWLDLVCDGYELPFAEGTLSHLILFDVFHHLEAPHAFLKEAQRVLSRQGRIVVFDPYISLASFPAYGIFHHEPVAWSAAIDPRLQLPRPRQYYAAQGNATRFFFGSGGLGALAHWNMLRAEGFADFSYLLSGGFSKRALYPRPLLGSLQRLDRALSRWPRLFGARCLVVLEKCVNKNSKSGVDYRD